MITAASFNNASWMSSRLSKRMRSFLLSWVWAIRFRVWWGLLALVPWVGFGMIIYLGLRGRELAWHRGTWSSVEAFNQTQRRWSIAGTVVVWSVSSGAGSTASRMGMPLIVKFGPKSVQKKEPLRASLTRKS